ncbi:MAG: hypothetical protein HYR96_05245 [Deltaproteobacteria bacterium]|nr:hypothetical protein [Deltaproteobacteria bacterium]MBI3294243.1 hypothetical protein [Deltaproteobacteria bacterium]
MKTLLICLMSFSLWAGDGAGTGSGPLESQFIYAFHHMDVFLTRTLLRPGLSAAEIEAIQKVLNNLRREKEPSQALVFEDNPKEFSWYEQCHQLKLAYTKLEQGALIRVNRALLYRKGTQEGELEANVSFSQIVQTVFHEIGHHNGYPDHQWLDQIGTKIARVAVEYVKEETAQIEKVFKTRPDLAPVQRPLALYGKYQVTTRSGFFLPHSTDLSTDNRRLFFLPMGTSQLYQTVPVSQETDRLTQAANHDPFEKKTSFFPFFGALDHLGVGTLSYGPTGQGYFSFDERNGLAMATVNIWEKSRPLEDEPQETGEKEDDMTRLKRNIAPLQVFEGKTHIDEYGRLALFTHWLKIPGDKSTVQRSVTLLKFQRPDFEMALRQKIQANGPPFGFYFALPAKKAGEAEVLTFLLSQKR